MPGEQLSPTMLEAIERLGAALRDLQDVATSTEAPAPVASAAAASIEEAADALRPYAAALGTERAFQQYVLTSSSHTLNPSMQVLRQEPGMIEMSVRFGPFFRNAFGYVNGGAIALMFDTAIAHVAFDAGRPSTTANLGIDYRSPAPVNTELRVIVQRESSDGRKHRIGAELRNGDQRVAEAHSLLIELPPAQ